MWDGGENNVANNVEVEDDSLSEERCLRPNYIKTINHNFRLTQVINKINKDFHSLPEEIRIMLSLKVVNKHFKSFELVEKHDYLNVHLSFIMKNFESNSDELKLLSKLQQETEQQRLAEKQRAEKGKSRHDN